MFVFDNKVAAIQLSIDEYSKIENKLRQFQARSLEDLLQLGLTVAQVQQLCLAITVEKNENGYQIGFPVFSVSDRDVQAMMIFNCSIAQELPPAVVSIFEIPPAEENFHQLMFLLLSMQQ